MPIIGNKLAFTRKNIDNAPDEPGVYALYVGGHLIYYGQSKTSIRRDLRDHLAGGMGECTAIATIYDRELALKPPTRQRDLLDEYKRAYGVLPHCNAEALNK
ncbi:MAG: hypothetical protein HN377_09580 [Alphaproteobacteria bacterium]|jgi:hypothetical protein|nr:hypothetical protein [Alphaproteobacteria bacterium]MBT7943284.1 hypothetical protein [Alphaproteobacteria bacterium]